MITTQTYNPIESVGALATAIDGIQEAYAKDLKLSNTGFSRSLASLESLYEYIKGSGKLQSTKSKSDVSPVEENIRIMECDFQQLKGFLEEPLGAGDYCYYYYKANDLIGCCYVLLNRLRTSIECVVFYPDVYINRPDQYTA